VLLEFKEYATEVDVEFVRKAVRAIGRCAIALARSAEACINVLLELIQTKVNYVVQEAICVIKDIFRRYPNQYESIIATLCENLDTLDEPEAKAAMIWIIGEYAERIDNADELLETFLETFLEEGKISVFYITILVLYFYNILSFVFYILNRFVFYTLYYISVILSAGLIFADGFIFLAGWSFAYCSHDGAAAAPDGHGEALPEVPDGGPAAEDPDGAEPGHTGGGQPGPPRSRLRLLAPPLHRPRGDVMQILCKYYLQILCKYYIFAM
jgi:hypothetical protein